MRELTIDEVQAVSGGQGKQVCGCGGPYCDNDASCKCHQKPSPYGPGH